MKKYIVLLIIGFALVCTSCTLTRKSVPATSFTPDIVRLELTMDQFEYLGETDISVTYKIYLGIFHKLDAINGVKHERKAAYDIKKVNFYGNHDLACALKRCTMKQAAYKLIEEFPNADYYIPINHQKKIFRVFGGKFVTETMKIKAYKFKN